MSIDVHVYYMLTAINILVKLKILLSFFFMALKRERESFKPRLK